MGYIYILTSPYGKSYVGQTTRPIHKRLEEHRTGQSNGCRAIYNAIQKYGWNNFEKDWYECPDKELNNHEELMVEVLGTLSPDGYNLKEGGGNHGKHSEESKKRVGDANRGKKRSKETKQKHSESTQGGKHHRSKKVYQYDLDGTFVNEFGSTGEAQREFQKPNGSNIRKCVCGVKGRETAYGFIWSYTN